MTDQGLTPAIRIAAALGGAAGFVTSAIFIARGHAGLLLTEGGAFAFFSVFFAVVAWMVAPSQPHNRVIWLMAGTALFSGLYIAAFAAAAALTPDGLTVTIGDFAPTDLAPAAAWILLAVVPLATGAIVAQMTFGLLLFPDGKLPSPRWRWVGLFTAAAVLLIVAAQITVFRVDSTTPISDGGVLGDVSGALFAVAALSALVALAGRFRRSNGTDRQQFKWILWGASILLLSLLVLMVSQGTAYEDLMLTVFAMAGAVFVASYGIAVGRYRLFDIDVVISRSVVYITLAVFITGTYIAAVLGVSGLSGADPTSNPWLFVGATALIALVFEPLRQRLQRLANRLVYGTRATPYEVLSEFSRNITSTGPDLLTQVARSLAEGTTAARASVWVTEDGLPTRAAAWPPDDGATHRPDADVDWQQGDMSRAVIHDGERLGVLTLTADRGQTLLPTDERLLDQVASGMGLALRNIGLSADLRRHVDDLRRSRGRLLTVQDETRRHLERELHDGAQQRLVALKVKLALARRQAEEGGFGEVAELLDAVAADTDRAIDSLRDFARGIYPPLLEAEGPGAALASQVRKLPIEVTIHAAGIPRHQRSIEAALYFCVLEALQNVVKHAHASSAHVAIHQSDSALSFEVSDDGVGFDPASITGGSGLANLVDRLDALDGSLEVVSSTGAGTIVRGSIPVGQGGS